MFATASCALMFVNPGRESIPFDLIWIGLAVVYGLQCWSARRTLAVLAAVCAGTGTALVLHVRTDVIGWEHAAEVPLMAGAFLVLVWHVRRRSTETATALATLASELNVRETQRRFVRFASHELRTPLTVARGYAELIRDQDDASSVVEDAGIVLDELAKLEGITSQLLQLAKLDRPAGLTFVMVDVDQVLEHVVRRWRPTAARRWSIDTHAGTARLDPDRLVTAVDSLVDNAVRYTMSGGLVAVTARREEADIVVCVTDDGEGISTDALPYVFESFRSGPRGGTGMGLAIVKGVVEAHGGTVHVENLPGGGSNFTLVFRGCAVAGSDETGDSVGRGTAAPLADPPR